MKRTQDSKIGSDGQKRRQLIISKDNNWNGLKPIIFIYISKFIITLRRDTHLIGLFLEGARKPLYLEIS